MSMLYNIIFKQNTYQIKYSILLTNIIMAAGLERNGYQYLKYMCRGLIVVPKVCLCVCVFLHEKDVHEYF